MTLVLGVLWFLPASGIEVLKPYQTARLTGFANPDADPSGLTYNVKQSITAVGSGGLDGRGVIEASQTRFDYLPEHATDFVFASFSEQRGFFGTAILLLLYLLVVWRGLRVITVAGDLYGAVVAGGIVFAFLFQVFVNVGMTMGIAPVTGIPLPFVTVGGSSMVANLVAVGILQSIHARGRAGELPAVTPVGIGPRDALALARHAQSAASPKGPLLVTGVLAEALARELRAGGDASLVRTDGDPADAAAVVRVVAGAATPEDERVLRAATRALVPTVVVQTGEPSVRIPYVLATDVVDVRARQGLSRRRDRARPRRRSGAGRRRARGRAARPAGRGAEPPDRGRRRRRPVRSPSPAEGPSGCSVLALAQARMLSDVATAGGAARPEAPRAVAEAVGAPAGGSPRRGARGPDARPPPAGPEPPARERSSPPAVTYALATAFRRFGRR